MDSQTQPQPDLDEVRDYLHRSGLRGSQIAEVSTRKQREVERLDERISLLQSKLEMLEDKRRDAAQDWKLWTAVFNTVAFANACQKCGQHRDYLDSTGSQEESDVAF